MGETLRLTAAQATVKYLQRQFSEFDGTKDRLIGGMFGIFGHGNVASISQALAEYGHDLMFYQPKNEQAMVHAAIGYAKAKNRRSTLACTASIGPGSMNMITGAATATVNRIPVLLLPADVFAHRRPGNVLQQLEHPIERDLSVNDCFRPVSRFFDRISRPEQILTALPEAMRVLTDPADTGAVTIAFPQDVEGEACDFPAQFFDERIWVIRRRPPSEQDLNAALSLLATASRPLIIAGGGLRYSAAEHVLSSFAGEFGIPIAETHAGKGTALDSAYCLGGMGVTGTAAAARIAERADVVIAIGTRLQDFVTGSRSAFRYPNVRFIAINPNAYDAHKLGGVPVIGDAKLSLEQIARGLRERRYATSEEYRQDIRQEVSRWRSRYAEDIAVKPGEPLTMGTVVKLVNETARTGDVVVAAAGTPPGEVHKGWDNSAGSECFIEFGFSTMGHEIPAGLGVRLARGDEGEVYVIIGDGTYLMSPTEIVTAAQERAKLTIILVENYGYQCIRDLQEGTTGVDNLGNEFRSRGESRQLDGAYLEVDYAANARSMGATALVAETPDELKQALARAKNLKGPVVVVAKAEARGRSIGSGVWWEVGVAQISTAEHTANAARTFLEGSKHQRSFL
jgi:3D-(3,5/4)-trihydroxycyclohexane-1,2-dione acylhydrolase (decyclizing)